MSGTDMVAHDEMPHESWKRLTSAAADPTHPMRLITFTTVTEDGCPDARILVLRGASRDLRCLWFHTDVRSAKVAQVRSHPPCCAVVYDPRDGVQMRIRGDVRVRSDDEIAERHWQQTELAARYAYANDPPPGEPLAHPDPRMREHVASLAFVEEQEGRENFVVLELNVSEIEWLQIGELGDRRAIMRGEDEFRPRPLVP